jgi:hypothetical protein
MPEIIYKMNECQKLVKHLSDTKREAVFKEGTLVNNIFKTMNKENNKLMKMNDLNQQEYFRRLRVICDI